MCATSLAARRRDPVANPSRGGRARQPLPRVICEHSLNLAQGGGYSVVDLGDSVRLSLLITPRASGTVRGQIREVLSVLQTVLEKQRQPMALTVQTVFLKSARDQAACERAFAEFYGPKPPVTNFVLQAPCGGAALAVEALAIGGKEVRVEHFGTQALAVSYDRVRWVHCAGIKGDVAVAGAYDQTMDALGRMRGVLAGAGSDYQRVVRTWFYLGGITEPEAGFQRYHELNRARTDFYRNVCFNRSAPGSLAGGGVYPASTGIGMAGHGLVASCLALETDRDDVFLVPLENPQQTPAYAYPSKYSPQSPKFSRAVALVLGNYLATWVSGTASIVDSESCHAGDPAKQTAQTLDNIERLIAADNFAARGVKGAGARLRDLAKIRVYLKRPEDLAECRAVCERRLGPVPAIYAVADICRPELLVEIEGVAFSRFSRG